MKDAETGNVNQKNIMSMNRAMKEENVTKDDLKEVLDYKGIPSEEKQECIILADCK
jgi:hypothetical protein